MKAVGGLLVLLFVLLLPALFGALIWTVALYFNPPQGVGQVESRAFVAVPDQPS